MKLKIGVIAAILVIFSTIAAKADFTPMGYDTARLKALEEVLRKNYPMNRIASIGFEASEPFWVLVKMKDAKNQDADRVFAIDQKTGCGFSFCGFKVTEQP